TCLAWALDRFERVETLGFAYGQRHAVELAAREPLRRGLAALKPGWAARLGPDRVGPLDVLGQVSHSALTSDLGEGRRDPDLPA
ncbi:7-cyano-7-deazaguanine synthase, partial [Acinetobacter baumannii]